MNVAFLNAWDSLSALRGECDLCLDALARFNADPTASNLQTLRIRAQGFAALQAAMRELPTDPAANLAAFVREAERR